MHLYCAINYISTLNFYLFCEKTIDKIIAHAFWSYDI
jgi:hypothetical protein